MPENPHDPIPDDLAHAFAAAVIRFDDWRGEPEADLVVSYRGNPTSISAIADAMASFSDALPDLGPPARVHCCLLPAHITAVP
jgi:hypothetical protein